MHPALSVIFFTTSSGAGYGLLAVLGVYAALGGLPQNLWFALTAMTLALGLITLGLLSSTLHLGHPERAWRALSQWRSSWLSREGVMAVLTYIPALAFGLGWAFPALNLPTKPLGSIAALAALMTVFTTAMIYRSLKPIRAWHNRYVAPGYLVLAIMTGAVLLLALSSVFGMKFKLLAPACGVLLAAGLTVKWLYWSFIDGADAASTPATATGLAGTGENVDVRVLEWPHTEKNYVLKEMGFAVARKHAAKLRVLAVWAGFLLPAIMIETTIFLLPPYTAFFAMPAALTMCIGIIAERWLFFAEAKHTVTLYYGAPSA